MELQQKLDAIRKQGLGLAAISYDSPAVLKDFAGRRGITFPLLSDSGSKVIRAFGILNEEAPKGTPFYGVPHPGTYLVDPRGRVVTKFFEEDYTERFTASDILVRQFGAPAGSARGSAETRHLALASAASTSQVRPGQRIALTLDIEMKPQMHVYAAGVGSNYIPIDWSMAASPAVAAHPPAMPPPVKLHLPAINETVPVYRGTFRLIRDITVAKSAKPGPLTVEGSLRYQACDDHMCYFPQTVPLKWTFEVEPLDRERAPAALQKKPGG